MQEKNNHFLSLGNCQRLFNIVKNILIVRGLKRVTMGSHPPPPGSTNVPPVDDSNFMNGVGSMEDQQPMNGALGKSSDDDLDDEIPILFKVAEELGIWTPVDELGYSVHISEENIPTDTGSQAPPLKDQTEENIGISNYGNGSEIEGKSSVEISIIDTKGKSLSMKDIEAEEAKKKQKEEVEPTEATQMEAPQTRLRFSGVLANINEIADAFIRTRKEAMKKNEL